MNEKKLSTLSQILNNSIESLELTNNSIFYQANNVF
jgi:hypothetical protein